MMLAFFTWCENTALGEAIRSSLWLFPVIESVHLLALGVMGGAVLLMNLRLLGWALAAHPVEGIWAETWPWLRGSWAVMIASGVPLFLSEAIKCYYSEAFWWKMSLLAAATLFTLLVVRRVAMKGGARRWVALASLALWTGVGASGRWIGFS